MSAPLASKSSIMATWPPAAATAKGVRPLVVSWIHFGAQLEEHFNQRPIVPPCGDMEECFSLEVNVYPGTPGHERFEYGDGPVGDGPVDGAYPARVGRVWICSMPQEHLHNHCVVFAGRPAQGRLSVLADIVSPDAPLQQRLDDIRVARLGRVPESSESGTVPNLRIHSLSQEVPHQ